MAFAVQQNVVQLQIPIYDTVAMQELQSHRHFSRIERGATLVEFARPLNLEHEITAVDVLHDEEQAVLRERRNEMQFERVG